MSDFLNACSAGDIDAARNIYQANNMVKYEKDENGLDCFLTATSEGRWKLAVVLLKELKVSPHNIDKSGETFYHKYPKGLKKNYPTDEDFADIKNDLMTMWQDDEGRERSRLVEIKKKIKAESQDQDVRAPKTLVKKTAELEREFFAETLLFLPKYVLSRYFVILGRKNADGKTPSEVAIDFAEDRLADYYDEELEYHRTRRRLIQGLVNSNLIREIGSYL